MKTYYKIFLKSIQAKLRNDQISVAMLITLSIMSLFANTAIFHYTFISDYFIILCFILILGLCYFTYKDIDYSTLIRLQIFYIIPFLVNLIFARYTNFFSYVLDFIIFALSNSIIFYLLFKKSLIWQDVYKSKWNILFISCTIGLLVIVNLYLINKVRHVILFQILILYLISGEDKDVIPISQNIIKSNYKKSYVYILIISFCYVITIFTNRFNVICYFLYLVSIINLCFCFRNNKYYFALVVLSIYFVSFLPTHISERYLDNTVLSLIILLFHIRSPVVYAKNTEYGYLEVKYDYKAHKIILLNDNIYHGERYLDKNYTSILYYGHHKTGPVATIFKLLRTYKDSKIAVLGLGTGLIATFAKKGQLCTFYEINPEIVKIAKNEKFFNYLASSSAKINIILGDARTKLSEASNHLYDLICVDVYVGQNIPKHFLTLEAMKLYLKKLSKRGVLLLHITNDGNILESILAKLVNELGVYGYSYYENASSTQNAKIKGLFNQASNKLKVTERLFNYVYKNDLLSSDNAREEIYSWVVIAKNPKNIASISNKWQKLYLEQNQELYTDQTINYRNNEIITTNVE